jgi:hypothetical protein
MVPTSSQTPDPTFMVMTRDQQKAHDTLTFIIPRIEERKMRWVITGGFACYAYGVERKLSDIDIDLDTSKENDVFNEFMSSLKPYMTQPLEHLVDKNYDNYNFEITIHDVIIDICPMAEMNIFDKSLGTYQDFYKDGFPRVEVVDFFGLSLSLLAKDLVIKNKEMLVWQRESDMADIRGLQALQ